MPLYTLYRVVFFLPFAFFSLSLPRIFNREIVYKKLVLYEFKNYGTYCCRIINSGS